jgi:hypothetical protein
MPRWVKDLALQTLSIAQTHLDLSRKQTLFCTGKVIVEM